MHFIRLPSVAENIENLTVEKWLVEAGQSVEQNDDLADIITEKANFTLQLEEDISGEILGLLVEERSVLPAGYIIAVIGLPAEKEDALAAAAEENKTLLSGQVNAVEAVFKKSAASGKAASSLAGKIRAAPSARRAAKDHDISLEDVAEALSISGIIREGDVMKYIEMKK
ncbi:MAG: lipoyl domain-containing protein [Planctomycetota bacterium]|jgi:pyruvate/2-oxoglutarate dehydrogenase complex dihydrolipoamide acyltransferase (E2) component